MQFGSQASGHWAIAPLVKRDNWIKRCKKLAKLDHIVMPEVVDPQLNLHNAKVCLFSLRLQRADRFLFPNHSCTASATPSPSPQSGALYLIPPRDHPSYPIHPLVHILGHRQDWFPQYSTLMRNSVRGYDPSLWVISTVRCSYSQSIQGSSPSHI